MCFCLVLKFKSKLYQLSNIKMIKNKQFFFWLKPEGEKLFFFSIYLKLFTFESKMCRTYTLQIHLIMFETNNKTKQKVIFNYHDCIFKNIFLREKTRSFD